MRFRARSRILLLASIVTAFYPVLHANSHAARDGLPEETVLLQQYSTVNGIAYNSQREDSSSSLGRTEGQCSDWITCPDCTVISEEVAKEIILGSPEGVATPPEGLSDSNGNPLEQSVIGWLQQGHCYKMCTQEEAAVICHSQRRLLQAGAPAVAKAPYAAAPSVPVSTSSPFSQGISPTSSSSQFTTYWHCGDTIMNAEIYHTLTLSIANGLCSSSSPSPGLHNCSGIIADQPTYSAILANQCSLEACSLTASCNFSSKYITAMNPNSAPASLPQMQPSAPPELPNLPTAPAYSPAATPASHSYLCGQQGQIEVSGMLYAAIQASLGCLQTAGPGRCTVGNQAVDFNLYATVKAGACNQASTSQAVSPASALTPLSSPVPLCSPSSYVCGADQNIVLEPAVYEAIRNATVCTPIGGSFCGIDDVQIESRAWAAVKAGLCGVACKGDFIYIATDSIAANFPASEAPGQASLIRTSTVFVNASGPIMPAPAQAVAACQFADVICHGNTTVHVSHALQQAIQSAATPCNETACTAAGFTVPRDIWEAVRIGPCQVECPQPLADCETPAPAPAPILGSTPQQIPATAIIPSPPPPAVRQAADQVLAYGDWDVCDTSCASEIAYRPLLCRNESIDLPVPVTSCDYSINNFQGLSEVCGSSSCSPYSWQAGTWGACSADCGEGISTRSIYCLLNGQRVDLSNCQNISAPPMQQEICFLKPCPPASWKTTPWTPCYQGFETRDVSCVTPNGIVVNDTVCMQMVGYQAARLRPCSTFQCFSQSDCSGNGVCNATTKTCTCSPGYQGPSCNIFLGPCSTSPAPAPAAGYTTPESFCCPTGVVDHLGNCCQSGVVAGSSGCCPSGSVLDNVGECCPPSKTLDPCGTCGGTGRVVDFLGACCQGQLDAGGRCCPAPLRVDQFGVCNGPSNTGMLDLTMNAFLPKGINAALYQSFNSSYAALIAASMHLNPSQVMVTNLGAYQATQGPSNLSAAVVLSPLYSGLPYGKAISLLNNNTNSSLVQELQLGSLLTMAAVGSPGNQVCEVGELPGLSAPGVPADCPITFRQVPESENGPCNNRGGGNYVQGQCDCWTGYEGDACDLCTAGYQPIATQCQRTYNSFQGYTIPPPTSGGVAGAALALPLSIALVGIAALAAVASVLVVKRRRRRAAKSADSLSRPAPTERKDKAITEMSSFSSSPIASHTPYMAKPKRSPGDVETRNSALHSRPLTFLVNWLTEKAEAGSDQSSHGSPTGTATDEHSHYTANILTEGMLPAPKQLSSDVSIRGHMTLEMTEILESPETQGAPHGTKIAKAEPSCASRQRTYYWTQEEEEGDTETTIVQTPSKTSPSEAYARRSFKQSKEESPEFISSKRKLRLDSALDPCPMSSLSEIPMAPIFQPVPAFVPTCYTASLDSRLLTPVTLLETADEAAPGRDQQMVQSQPPEAAGRFWTRLPLDGSSHRSQDAKSSKSRWKY